MSLLREIQVALMNPAEETGPILLKLRLLASRLGSVPLEDWVRFESEGYPPDAELPPYRKIPVSYLAHFSGPFGSGIKNAPIPLAIINEFAGERWMRREVRESVSVVDALAKQGEKSGSLTTDAADLIFALQGKIYENYACNSVIGRIASSSLVGLLNAVRSKILELTSQLEKSVPNAAEIELASQPDEVVADQERVTRITQQIFYGDVTTHNVQGLQLNLLAAPGDTTALVKTLVGRGIAEPDAQEFADILSNEEADGGEIPLPKQRYGLARTLVRR